MCCDLGIFLCSVFELAKTPSPWALPSGQRALFCFAFFFFFSVLLKGLGLLSSRSTVSFTLFPFSGKGPSFVVFHELLWGGLLIRELLSSQLDLNFSFFSIWIDGRDIKTNISFPASSPLEQLTGSRFYLFLLSFYFFSLSDW